MKCYVGWYNAIPDLGVLEQWSVTLHPTLFREQKQLMIRDVFTNNPLIVNEFEAEDVMVISQNGLIEKLSQHPLWEEHKDSFTSGDFWLSVGDEWVDEIGGSA